MDKMIKGLWIVFDLDFKAFGFAFILGTIDGLFINMALGFLFIKIELERPESANWIEFKYNK